jgi:hypothetical protein
MSDRADQRKFVRGLQRDIADKKRELAELESLLADAERDLIDSTKAEHRPGTKGSKGDPGNTPSFEDGSEEFK